MPSLFEYISQKRKIKKSPLPKEIKSRLLSEYKRLSFKKIFISKKSQLNSGIESLLGFEINHLGFRTLFHLYNEVFVNLDYLTDIDNDKPFIIDCGANMGMSVLFQKMLYPNAEIICFEPDQKTFEILSRNVETNKLTDTYVHQQAVSDHKGMITFYFDPDNEGSLQMSTIEERSPQHSCEVEAVLLSEYITKQVDLLKMDIEGAELSVLKELDISGKIGSIDRIIIEFHHHIKDDIDDLSITLNILEKNGFGYQLFADHSRPIPRGLMQDIMIYAYRK